MASLLSTLWGPWAAAYGSWTWNDVPSYGWHNAYVSKFYNLQALQGMITGGPDIRTNTITVVDENDGFTDSATVTVRAHAPWESPVWTSTEEKESDPVGVTPWVVRSPYGPITITQSIAWSLAITKSLTLGINGSAFDTLHPLVQALSLSFQYGQTATVTTTNTVSTTIETGPPDTEFRLVKQALWLESEGFYLGYGPSGYMGLQDMLLRHWVSGNKEEAEKSDHRYLTVSRPYNG